MSDWLQRSAARTAVAAVVVGLALAPAAAWAHGRGGHGGFRGGVAFGGGYYAPWFGYGYGYSPYGWYGAWGPYPPAYYQPEGGVPLSVALMSGFGGVDLDVKPNRADVWVDGKYAGEARDFDGYPSYLWLKQGVHRVQVYKGGFRTFDEEIEVQPGAKKDLRIRLEPGESAPPGVKPGEGGRPSQHKTEESAKES